MASSYVEDAERDGHDIETHTFIKNYVDDGVTHFTMKYATTQRGSARGPRRRKIIIEREGANRETELGADDDTRPGWWVIDEDGQDKFFLSARIIDVDMLP